MILFSYKILATNVFNHINNNIFSIIFGKYYSEKEVGYYNQGNKWNNMGYSFITGMINNVAQPIFSKVVNDNTRLLRIFRKMIRFTSFVSFPTMLGLALVAPELITITITTKWLESAFILQILCVGGAFIPITGLCSYFIISKGKSNIYMWNSYILGILQIAVMFFIHPLGIHTMIATYVSINISWLFIWYYFVKREIKYRFYYLILDICPYLAISIVTIIVTHYLTLSIINIYFLLFAKILIASCLYFSIIWLSGANILKESLQYLFKYNKK